MQICMCFRTSDNVLTYEKPDIFRPVHLLLIYLAENFSGWFGVEETHHNSGILQNTALLGLNWHPAEHRSFRVILAACRIEQKRIHNSNNFLCSIQRTVQRQKFVLSQIQPVNFLNFGKKMGICTHFTKKPQLTTNRT